VSFGSLEARSRVQGRSETKETWDAEEVGNPRRVGGPARDEPISPLLETLWSRPGGKLRLVRQAKDVRGRSSLR